MKTYLLYGFAMAFVGALLNVVLYLLGYHTDLAKFQTAQTIGIVVALLSCVTCLVLGTRAKMAETPLGEEFGYGSAWFAGVAIMFFGAAFGLVFNLIYMQVINPGFMDLVTQFQLQKMEARGMSAGDIERVETGMRKIMNPVFQSIIAFIGSMIVGTILSLVTAAFIRRGEKDVPPMVA